MKNYVIIDADAIQKRIDELEKELKYLKGGDTYVTLGEINSLKQILSQSTPLIPEIEKAFVAGERYGWDSQKSIGNIDEMREKIKLQSLDNYITNLKLDI